MIIRRKSWKWQVCLTTFIATGGVWAYFRTCASAQSTGRLTVNPDSNLIIIDNTARNFSCGVGILARPVYRTLPNPIPQGAIIYFVKGIRDWGLGIGVVVFQTKNYVRGNKAPYHFWNLFPIPSTQYPRLVSG
ncbi:hypothetical protein NIES4073_39030 [Kalymmatonema gypsitolerans NIES-4073]|nr:hypothetical protein NIES4073_39030 [Scytonema sp. NIES-4073]